MPSRRTVLGRLVGTVIGGALAAGTAAGSAPGTGANPGESAPSGDRRPGRATSIYGTVDTSVLPIVGVPEPVASPLAEFERATAASLADVERVSGAASFQGEQLRSGVAVATGRLDVADVAAGIQEAEPRFERVRRDPERLARGDGESGRFETPTTAQTEAGGELFVLESEPSLAASVAPTRLAVTAGTGDIGTERALSNLEALSRSGWRVSRVRAFPGLLDGHAVVEATLDGRVRERLLAEIPEAATAFRGLLRATRAGGLALRAGSSRSVCRYAASVDPSRLEGGTISGLLADLAGRDGVELVGTDVDRGRLVADVSFDDDTVWTAHADVLGLDW